MNESKALRLIRKFTARERRLFRNFLPLSSADKEGRLLSLWDYLASFAPHYKAPALSREEVYAVIWGREKVFDDKEFRYLLADLTHACEEFLSWLEWKKDRPAQGRYLLRALDQRQLESDFHRKSTELRPQADYSPLDTLLFYQTLHDTSSHSGGREADTPTHEAMKALDTFYLLHKLRYACAWVSRANVFREQTDIHLIEAVCAEARTDLYQTHTLIQLYLAGLQILLDPSDVPSFARLRHLLEESGQQIPEAEQRNLYFLLLNVCIKRLNQGEAEAGTAIFEIYGSLLSRELLLENGYLAPGHFKNVVAIGVRLREFERTERFIESYHLQLPPAEHESVYAYNQAYLAFSRGEYRQVLRLLRRSEWNDLYYQLDARVLLIKTYYEMGDFEGLEYDINSLRTFLRRNRRISAYQQRLFQHLVRAMQLFLRFYAGQERAEHLIQFLESHPDTAGLAWLKQKAQEIQT